MKHIILAVATIALTSTIFPAQAQNKDIKIATIHVDGVCGQCKKRIENAAYLPGVKLAEWDKNSNNLTVTYRPSKVTEQQIAKEIAAVGHNAGEEKASEKAYAKLPACCSYNDEKAMKH